MIFYRSVNPLKTDGDIMLEYAGVADVLKDIVANIATRHDVKVTGGKTAIGHSSSGFHPRGMAVDFVVGQPGDVSHRAALLQEITTLYPGKIGGIGVMNGCSGFHVDTRPNKTYWGYGPAGQGETQYTPADARAILEKWRTS